MLVVHVIPWAHNQTTTQDKAHLLGPLHKAQHMCIHLLPGIILLPSFLLHLHTHPAFLLHQHTHPGTHKHINQSPPCPDIMLLLHPLLISTRQHLLAILQLTKWANQAHLILVTGIQHTNRPVQHLMSKVDFQIKQPRSTSFSQCDSQRSWRYGVVHGHRGLSLGFRYR